VQANALILVIAIVLDIVVLGAFLTIKVQTDVLIIIVSVVVLALVFAGEWLFLRSHPEPQSGAKHQH
jgi:hypothetical protein